MVGFFRVLSKPDDEMKQMLDNLTPLAPPGTTSPGQTLSGLFDLPAERLNDSPLSVLQESCDSEILVAQVGRGNSLRTRASGDFDGLDRNE